MIKEMERAAFYGDTLFETLRVFNGKVLFMPQHWARLVKGLSVMNYDLPHHWTAAYFESRIRERNARVRLSVFRSPGGLYLPTDNSPQFLISSTPLPHHNFQWPEKGLHIGFSDSVRLPVDGLSGLKAPNAPRYVAAAIEANKKGWHDVLLLNSEGRVCEASSSNVFWIKDGCVFTPPLSDGPVTGIMRELFFNLKSPELPQTKEKTATKADILNADEVFLTNAVRGVVPVAFCEGKAYGHAFAALFFQVLVAHIEALLAR